ncbi:gnat family [Trichoderma arundinaceum]|uniref:Gnat family n=1 Tax=Trichoderma arundinaceum TaxID=490622 RepID=A0A395NKB1_TRIAR|nr:gnat family [Trichoderma arundinaceum]
MSPLERPVTTTFISERLVYRSLQPTDKQCLYEMISEPGCIELAFSKIPSPPNRKEWDEMVDKPPRELLQWTLICLREESSDGRPMAGKPIGCLSLSQPSSISRKEHRSSELGILLAEAYRGKGYGAEAMKWIMDWAFNYAGLHRIWLESWSFNEAALQLWEKLGFKLEGRLRESVWFQRKWYDRMVYGILEQEWEATQ